MVRLKNNDQSTAFVASIVKLIVPLSGFREQPETFCSPFEMWYCIYIWEQRVDKDI